MEAITGSSEAREALGTLTTIDGYKTPFFRQRRLFLSRLLFSKA